MLIIIIVVLVSSGISFLCSLWEAALYSVPISRMHGMIEDGVRGARLLLYLRERVEQPISAILTFNTIANTIGASVAGGLVAQEYGTNSWHMVLFPPLFALVILIFSEIIPKTLGVTYADRIAPISAYALYALIIALYPFVRMSQYVTGKIRQAAQETEKTVSEADLISQARIGVEEGTLFPEEALWLTNALRLNEKTAHDLMTPRPVVFRLPAETKLSEISAHSDHWTHSRLPLCRRNDPDKVVGLVYRREVFDTLINKEREEHENITLEDMAHPVDFIPETLRGHQLLQRFLQGRHHLFIVTNEHGGMEGVITLEDVLEELIGAEIVDPHDVHADMQEYARLLAQRRTEGAGIALQPAETKTPESKDN